jgi:hypothetical protein
VIAVTEQLIKIKIKITFIQNNADAVESLENSIQTGDIATAMNPFMVVEKCLSTIHVQNGSKENGNYLLSI